LAELLNAHEWKELFWRRRAELNGGMSFCLFGHGLAEKMLAPYPGVTGRGLIVEVAENFNALPLSAQLQALDAQVAARFASQEPLAARLLSPVPLLGIPSWCADNEDERYYDNTAYFRPTRDRR